MIEKIKTFKGKVYLNLLNVDYKATEEDLKGLFSYIKVFSIEATHQKGIFLMLVNGAEDALKLFTEEEKVSYLIQLLGNLCIFLNIVYK